MPCPSGKIEHPTREDALVHQKELVHKDYLLDHSERSAGLAVYPCDQCPAWHVGHARGSPPAYHYVPFSQMHDLVRTRTLRPIPPTRIPKRELRQLTGPALLHRLADEEPAPLLWFTWNANWDLHVHPCPHPHHLWIDEYAHMLVGGGTLRHTVPSSLAKLRWSDYLRLNRTSRVLRDAIASMGNPADWLATDSAIPMDRIRTSEVFYRDRWVDLETLDWGAYEAYYNEVTADWIRGAVT